MASSTKKKLGHREREKRHKMSEEDQVEERR
jgi:hypothetical protein